IGHTIDKFGGLQEAERDRFQEVLLLAALGRLSHQVGRFPLGKYNLMAPRFEPLVQELDLRALAGAVDPFDDDQPATSQQSSAPRHSLFRMVGGRQYRP